MADKTYPFKFKSVGGTSRVAITSGEDLKHLAELDQKLWTVLSCPSTGLEFDDKTLAYMDADHDGKIRVNEVVATSQWLTSVISNADNILKGEDGLALSDINTANPDGARLHDSAEQILRNLGLDKKVISVADTSDSIAIFAKTQFNGDGVITPASADDETLKATIETIVKTTGAVKDRSGEDGIDADKIEAFYTACADYAAWQAAGQAEGVLPYGADTEAALAAVESLKEKVADYFMRSKLAAFDGDTAKVLDVQVEKVGEISAKNLSACAEEIAAYPLARISGNAELPVDGINPAWQAQWSVVKSVILDKDFAGKESISEADWAGIAGKFAAYSAWKADKKGDMVEPLGLEAVQGYIKADSKAALLALVEQDKALEAEATSIGEVDKLVHLYRDFAKFLRNYITFDDFYAKDVDAIFQAGTLYIDQRSLNLCVRVDDMGKHGDMAGLSGMYIIYCACTSKSTGKSLNIAAVLTDGDVDNLRVGMNAIFYDRNGLDYDATVTKIVDNPVSVRQAFWSPYKKLARTISDRINKSAADKESKVNANLTEKANTTNVPTTKEETDAAKQELGAKTSSFDIAKFAGIFAAIGMAVAYLTAAIAKLVSPLYNILILIVVLIICISGPSMFLAWQKLRKRNLAPVLNANGWAINARVLVNIAFGAGLTSLAKFPSLESVDPAARKKARARRAKKALAWIVVIVLAAGACYHFWYKPRQEAKAAAEAEAAAQAQAAADSIAAAEAVQATEAPADTVTLEEAAAATE